MRRRARWRSPQYARARNNPITMPYHDSPRARQVCQLEHQLFDGFFPGADGDGGGALGALMDPLCTVLYDALRPAFIQLADLGSLCELVDILQHEARLCAAGRAARAR
jgi:hypothetical protein